MLPFLSHKNFKNIPGVRHAFLPNLVLGSDSADCPIVLFADDKARVIGLAHAGWKGAKKGIISATMSAMIKLGANSNHISALIGPCIAQNSYEVSLDFYQDFLQQHESNTRHFQATQNPQHFMFDLRGYVVAQLQQAGLSSIDWMDIDTYFDERFFSCRRAKHQGEPDFGGNFSIIAMT
jgi:YfiH family protein